MAWPALSLTQGIERLAEARIMAAIEAGEFDALPGRGAPLRLEDDALVAPEWRTAVRLLKGAGMAPGWIEGRKELDREIDHIRSMLAAVPAGSVGRAEAERCFSERAVLLNRRTLLLNLSAPGPRWARPVLDIEREISRLGAPAVTADGSPPALRSSREMPASDLCEGQATGSS